MPDYYIHLTDSSFAEPPWPGERRLGPYATKKDADFQAMQNSTTGIYNSVGVFTDAASAQRHDDLMPDYYTKEAVRKQAEAAAAAEHQRLLDEATATLNEGLQVNPLGT